MTNKHLGRWVVVGAVGAATAISANSQSQQHVQPTQLTVKEPVAADPLSEWEMAYSEAMKVASELAEEGSIGHARRLVDDLEDVDEALREYVRASKRLRHKDRAYAENMELLVRENVVHMESRWYETLSHAAKVAHDVEQSTIGNMRR